MKHTEDVMRSWMVWEPMGKLFPFFKFKRKFPSPSHPPTHMYLYHHIDI